MKSFILFLIFVGFAQSVLAEKPKTFFPTSERGDKSTISSFEEEWYSKHLRLMEQPSLYAKVGDKSADVYRFTLLPTWGDPRCAVVTKRDGKAEIFFARLDGDGGYDPGKLVEKAKRELSPEESKRFFTLFDALLQMLMSRRSAGLSRLLNCANGCLRKRHKRNLQNKRMVATRYSVRVFGRLLA